MRSVPNWPLVFFFLSIFIPLVFFYMCATDVLCALRVVFFPIIDCCTVNQSGRRVEHVLTITFYSIDKIVRRTKGTLRNQTTLIHQHGLEKATLGFPILRSTVTRRLLPG